MEQDALPDHTQISEDVVTVLDGESIIGTDLIGNYTDGCTAESV